MEGWKGGGKSGWGDGRVEECPGLSGLSGFDQDKREEGEWKGGRVDGNRLSTF